jgi:hypothetical protein
MYRKINWVGGLAALALIVALPATALAAGVVLHADLLGDPASSAHGTVDYQANHQGTQAKLRISIEGVRGTPLVYVIVPGKFIGTIPLAADGNGALHLATRRGDDVPALSAGDVVDVYVQDSGLTRIVLKGLLRQQ